jgi:hypothetical protein
MTLVGYDATTGERLWIKDHSWNTYSARYGPAMDGVFTIYTHRDLTFKGFDIFSGEELWESEPLDSGFDLYQRNFVGAYGRIYSNGIGGRVYCLDITNGERLWTFYAGSAGYETPLGVYPFLTDLTVADGKVFAINGEHSANTPLYTSNKLYGIDAYTGESLWNISHFSGTYRSMVEADGNLATSNIYDNSIYIFGKGQTETTVTAPDIGVPLGSSVMIRGTVTDQSAGATGTPAISDEDMTEWMEYIYMQQPMPGDAQGVTVKLYAIDPNGNYQDIGETTSDIWGTFGKSWTPPVEGEYLIIAEFAGTKSYYKSSSVTYITVDAAPSPSTPIEPEPTEAPLITTEIAIIAAVVVAVVIGIVAFWALRKRK